MYLIVGLGNPENQYSKTRHNMGFDTINKIASSYNIDINKNKFKIDQKKTCITKKYLIQCFSNFVGL